MITRKLKDFEYAGFVQAGNSADGMTPHQDSFQTPNGYALVIACCEDQEQGQNLAGMACERIRYYLNHEVLDNPLDVVQNALLYVNGYLFEHQRKESIPEPVGVSCLCLLVQNQKVYYSWAGKVCMFLFEGKKWVPLISPGPSSIEENPSQPLPINHSVAFLGLQKIITPGVCEFPLQPIDQDIVVMGTLPVSLSLSEKDAKRILLDSMPAQTKVMRLVKLIKQMGNDDPIAIQLLSFYNMDQQERSYAAVVGVKSQSDSLASRVQEVWKTEGRLNIYKLAAILIALLVVSYMVYDLFLFEPQPSTQIITVDPVRELPQEPAPVGVQEEHGVSLPQDVAYTVIAGDTWGRIYQRYEVCSWFIRNHPPNEALFENANDPVAGTRLMIPVMYSAKASLNPDYYKEFSTNVVGTSCEHAGQEFLQEFEAKLKQ